MCGIGFVIRMEDVLINKWQLDALLMGLQVRGKDASGVALQMEDGSIEVHKSAQSAGVYTGSRSYEEFLKEMLPRRPVIALLHTRHMTTGHWSKNENNHPLEGENVALVHNGMVSNYKKLFTEMNLTAKCETDSDIMRAIVDEHGFSHKCIRELEKVTGSAAIAVLDKRNPGQLLLAKCSNPLEVALSDDFIYGASLMQPIYIANKTWGKKWGFYAHQSSRLERVLMPTDTAWLIDRKGAPEPGFQWHQEFKMSYGDYNWGHWHGVGDNENSSWYSKAICDECGHEERSHKIKDKGCWQTDCKCHGFKKKGKKQPKEKDMLDMNSCGVEYICPHCKKTCFVPMHLKEDRFTPEKLTCPKCSKKMKGAEIIVGRKSSS